MPYATTDDLEARWRPLTATERPRAATLLADAAVRIDAFAPMPEGDEQQAEIRKIISCDMVKRAMQNGGETAGVTQQSQTSGPFGTSTTYANPSGDLYLTAADKKLLGYGKQKAFTIGQEVGYSGQHRPWCALAFGALYCSCGSDLNRGEGPIFEGA